MRRIGGIIFSLIWIGIGIFVLSLMGNVSNKYTAPATGIIQGYDTVKDDDGANVHYPVVSYTFNGKHYTETSSSGSSSKPYADNEEVEILVNPNNGYEFMLKDGSKLLKLMPWSIIIIGILLLISQVLSFFGILRPRRAGGMEAGLGLMGIIALIQKIKENKNISQDL